MDIQSVYDFDKFFQTYRPKRADYGLQKHFSVDIEVRGVESASHVFVRSKTAIGTKTPWSAWTQMYPSVLDARPTPPHASDTIPPVMDNKQWEDFAASVVPTLTK